MLVIFTRSDGTAEKAIDVSPDSKLGEDREEVQMLLGLPVNPPYKLVLKRTEEELEDNLTFEEAGIQNNDKLILSPPTDKKKPPPPAPTPAPAPPPSPSPSPTQTLPNLDWRTPVIVGGVIGVFILVGFALIDPRPPIPPPPPSPSPTEPLPSPPQPSPEQSPALPTPRPSISEEKAVQLVQRYLEAKKVMFAPPYNRQIVSDIGTGEFYKRVIGSINSLQIESGGAYYKYGVQRIDKVENFVLQGNTATIQVKITEDFTLYNRNGSIDKSNSGFKTLTAIYSMKLINGNLKIYGSKLI